MERKPKVTAEAVATACEKLTQNDKNVTVNAVIAITGGSFSTVGEMVKAWREQQRQQQAPAFDIPDSVTAAMREATTTIWTAASSLAADTVETIQKQAQEATEKANSELAEYAGEVARLEKALMESTQQQHALSKALEQSNSNATELTAQLSGVQARLDDRDNELERLRADYEKFQAELVAIAKSGKGAG